MKLEEADKMLTEVGNKPYPNLQYIEKNPRYAKLLYDDLAGELGELSAITQYIYEHMTLSDQGEISDILLKIAIQEMRHLNIVGDIIKRSGSDPCYINSKGEAWSSNYIHYNMGNIKEVMQYNIYTEEVAIKGYRQAILHTRNQSIRKMLNRILLDEQNHIKVFQYIMQKAEL